ncbi:MAG: glycosyltransferase family 2 protein [Actinobacteria bacterium]|nr:glycosyltransferase family 2 protein [Actinomycetota bacterium]
MFRSGAYLSKCLASIARQTYGRRRVEVLCIDDGSDDGTVELAQEVLRSHRLHGTVTGHAHSGSPASARNTAIDAASGRYLYFVDVDDYLGRDALRSMLRLADREQADIVVGKYVGVGRSVPRVMFSRTLARTDVITTPVTDSMSVLKMYRTAYARSLGYRFNPGLRMAEDHPFAMAAYTQTDRVAIQASVNCYYWVKHTSAAAAAQHLTGHVLPVDEFYAYFFEVFGVLDGVAETHAQLVEWARRRYWQRLYQFDLPNEARRDRDEAGRRESILMAQRIMASHGGIEVEGLSAKARAMRRALLLGDSEMVEAIARLI